MVILLSNYLLLFDINDGILWLSTFNTIPNNNLRPLLAKSKNFGFSFLNCHLNPPLVQVCHPGTHLHKNLTADGHEVWNSQLNCGLWNEFSFLPLVHLSFGCRSKYTNEIPCLIRGVAGAVAAGSSYLIEF